jgi:hypothetical protein
LEDVNEANSIQHTAFVCIYSDVIFEVFTAVTTKNAVFWDI